MGRRLRVSDAEFRQVWREVIAPDLDRRHGESVERMIKAQSAADFLEEYLAMIARLHEMVLEGKTPADDLPWDEMVESLEVMTFIARKRCSIR